MYIYKHFHATCVVYSFIGTNYVYKCMYKHSVVSVACCLRRPSIIWFWAKSIRPVVMGTKCRALGLLIYINSTALLIAYQCKGGGGSVITRRNQLGGSGVIGRHALVFDFP